MDDYGHHVESGFCVIKVRYLEQATEKSNRINYRILKKNVYVFKESAVNLTVNFDIRKNYHCDIIVISSTLECLHYKNVLHILIFILHTIKEEASVYDIISLQDNDMEQHMYIDYT